MTTTPLENTTEPVGGVPAAVERPASPPEAIQPAAAVVIKPWQVAAAVLAVVITVLGFMWQMQTGLSGIREEVREGDASLRQELYGIREEVREGDASLRQEIAEIRTLQIQIVDRLSRIEGHLGVGLPDDLAERAPGAGWAGSARAQSEGWCPWWVSDPMSRSLSYPLPPSATRVGIRCGRSSDELEASICKN